MVIAVEERSHEWDERERVGRIGEQGKVGDELVFRDYLEIITRLGLPIVHRILLHTHKGGVRIGL